jgi:hypothetical protein
MNNLDELCVNTIRGVCLVDSILKAQPGESGLA